MGRRIDYFKEKNKYYNGEVTVDFDIDTNVMTDEQLRNQKELINSLNDMRINVPKQGEIYTLTYVGMNKESLMFEGGFKDYVRVDNKPSELKYFTSLSAGDEIDLLITNVNERKFSIEGSIAHLYESKAHEAVKSLREEECILALIKELTPAGFNVDLYHDTIVLPGFMPNTLSGINKVSDPETLVGKTMEVMIESFSKEEGTYIVSRRKYLQSLIPDAIKELKTHTVYTGRVTGTSAFGVFVEFAATEGGVVCCTGMIHKTNIDPAWADRITSIPAGFEIEFYVKEVIKDSKIILTQILKESLWDTIEVGQVLTGAVKETKSFGVLVNLDGETVGLIKTNELDRVGKEYTNGQQVRVRVISAVRYERKICLSIV